MIPNLLAPLGRVIRHARDEAVGLYAAGISFYLLLAFVPTLGAIVSIYGLVTDQQSVVDHLALLDGVIPDEIIGFLESELGSLASAEKVAGWTLVFSVLLAIWGSSRAIGALTIALNRIYGTAETRGRLERKLNSLGIAAGLLLFFLSLLLFLVAVPAVTALAGLDAFSDRLMTLARWPLLFVAALAAITATYRFAPCRKHVALQWLAPGSLFAAVTWVFISLGLTYYTTEIGWASKTYGSLKIAALLLFFFYLSSIAFLIGGVINAQTAASSDGTGEGIVPLPDIKSDAD